MPLSFEANRGQVDNRVKFLAHGRDYTLFLTATEALLSFKERGSQCGAANHVTPHGATHAFTPAPRPGQRVATSDLTPELVRMSFVGSNPVSQVFGRDQLPGDANYFIGSDPKNCRTKVPTYAKVQYKNIYPGIDLVYYGNQRQLEYDFVLAPGADPRNIRLSLQGKGELKVDARGDLVIGEGGERDIRFHKPRAYQKVDDKKQDVLGRYVLVGADQVAFKVPSYDARRPLMIDPVLSYSTYLGGGNFDQANGIAVDSSGNA